MHKRQETLSNLRVREKQVASALNMSYAADRFFFLLLSFFALLLPDSCNPHYVYEDFTLRFDQCGTILTNYNFANIVFLE
jgi:hypothetical protein